MRLRGCKWECDCDGGCGCSCADAGWLSGMAFLTSDIGSCGFNAVYGVWLIVAAVKLDEKKERRAATALLLDDRSVDVVRGLCDNNSRR